MMKNLLYISYKIEPVFYKIVYMSIIASIIGIVILIIKRILKKEISPKWINRIWLVFLISLIIPIQFKSAISIYNNIPINFEQIENISISREEYIKKSEETIEVNSTIQNKKNNNVIQDNNNNLKINLLSLLPLIWLTAVVSSVVACIITYFVFESKIREKEIQDENFQKILNTSKEKLNIKKDIKLVKQDIIKMPSIFGILNVRILVNDNILELSDKEIEYIFMHELAHYKRKDNILTIFITLLRCIYIFNPLIWILLNELKNDLELATDSLAIENENVEIQKEYSKTLVKVSAINADKFLIQAMCLSDSKKNLERRIDNVKLVGRFKRKNLIIVLISIIIIVLLVLVLWTRSDNYMSEKDIVKIYHKASKINNVHYIKEKIEYYSRTNEKIITYEDYYFKDDVVYKKVTNQNGEILSEEYIDYDNNEAILIENWDSRISIFDISNVEEKNRISKFGITYSQKEYNTDKTNGAFEYLGIEEINEQEAYKYKTTVVDKYNNSSAIIWVDKKMGVELKEEYVITSKENENDFNNNRIETYIYTYEFDKVTDEDMKKPDLSIYEDYIIDNKVYYSLYY